MSARERLAELEAAVRTADERARRVDAERRRARRSHERALGPWRGYWRAVGAGGERDPEREAELEAEVREVRSAITMRPVVTDGRVSDLPPWTSAWRPSTRGRWRRSRRPRPSATGS